MAEVREVLRDFERYMSNGADRWFERHHAGALPGPVAYFCAEYGLSEALGIYSGGLGVLAGDHMKTTSDMALPFVGVGLMYRRGYFHQTIDADGHQEHAYPDYDLRTWPVGRVQGRDGDPLTVTVALPGRDLHVAVWCVQVGRTPVLLLDTDIPENDEGDRPITHILYVRGREMRLHQELVLGAGGVRALRALGIDPAVWHLNEGHSAFLLAERAREFVAAGDPLDEAWAKVRRDSVFTIHTPVSAGNERFAADLVRRIASPLLDGDGRPQTGGVPIDEVLQLGLGSDGRSERLRHDRVLAPPDARRECRQPAPRGDGGCDLARHLAPSDPRGHERDPRPDVVGQRRHRDARAIAGREPGRPRRARARSGPFWERLAEVPTAELWETHQREKLELAIFARRRLRVQFARHGEAPATLDDARRRARPGHPHDRLRPAVRDLQAGRPAVQDLDRLSRILWNADRPVQIVYAGKAHPADRPGQEVIQEIFTRSRSEKLRGRVFILEDYDMRIARYLVAGVDVWLNNPRRPLEASGTSGMKAAVNGAVNLSVLDGWWDEGWTGDNGWAIGGREMDPDEGAQDWADVQDLYRLLEEEVVPRYYDRARGGLPEAWVDLMRRSMASRDLALLDDPDAPRLRREDVPAGGRDGAGREHQGRQARDGSQERPADRDRRGRPRLAPEDRPAVRGQLDGRAVDADGRVRRDGDRETSGVRSQLDPPIERGVVEDDHRDVTDQRQA